MTDYDDTLIDMPLVDGDLDLDSSFSEIEEQPTEDNVNLNDSNTNNNNEDVYTSESRITLRSDSDNRNNSNSSNDDSLEHEQSTTEVFTVQKCYENNNLKRVNLVSRSPPIQEEQESSSPLTAASSSSPSVDTYDSSDISSNCDKDICSNSQTNQDIQSGDLESGNCANNESSGSRNTESNDFDDSSSASKDSVEENEHKVSLFNDIINEIENAFDERDYTIEENQAFSLSEENIPSAVNSAEGENINEQSQEEVEDESTSQRDISPVAQNNTSIEENCELGLYSVDAETVIHEEETNPALGAESDDQLENTNDSICEEHQGNGIEESDPIEQQEDKPLHTPIDRTFQEFNDSQESDCETDKTSNTNDQLDSSIEHDSEDHSSKAAEDNQSNVSEEQNSEVEVISSSENQCIDLGENQSQSNAKEPSEELFATEPEAQNSDNCEADQINSEEEEQRTYIATEVLENCPEEPISETVDEEVENNYTETVSVSVIPLSGQTPQQNPDNQDTTEDDMGDNARVEEKLRQFKNDAKKDDNEDTKGSFSPSALSELEKQRRRNLIFDEERFAETFLKCLICREVYNETDKLPKMLHCHHTFCMDCLYQMYRVEGEFRQSLTGVFRHGMPMTVKIQCPTCREGIIISEAELRRLPNDHTIMELLSFVSNTGKNDVQYCSKHQMQPLNFFCEPCIMPVCCDCTVIDHKESKGHIVVNVDEAMKKYTPIVEQTLGDIKAEKVALADKRDSLENAQDDLDRIQKDLTRQIRAVFDNIREVLDERERELHGMSETEIERKREILDGHMKTLVDRESRLNAEFNELQKAKDDKDISLIFTGHKSARDVLANKVFVPTNSTKGFSVTFSFSSRADSVIKQQLANLGDIIFQS